MRRQQHELVGLAGIGQHQHDVVRRDHPEVAVRRFGGMHEERRRAGRRQRRGELARDVARLADAGHDDAAAAVRGSASPRRRTARRAARRDARSHSLRSRARRGRGRARAANRRARRRGHGRCGPGGGGCGSEWRHPEKYNRAPTRLARRRRASVAQEGPRPRRIWRHRMLHSFASGSTRTRNAADAATDSRPARRGGRRRRHLPA